MKKILLTGRPGVGKTTIIRKVVEGLKKEAGGFYTEEIREEGRRLGFKIKSLEGKEDILAHLNYRSKFKVGKYGVNVEAFERVALPAIEEAMATKDLIILDELGRMELFSSEFQEVVWRALDSGKSVLGVIQERHNEFLDKIRSRKDVEIIRVTEENRGKLPAQVIKMLT